MAQINFAIIFCFQILVSFYPMGASFAQAMEGKMQKPDTPQRGSLEQALDKNHSPPMKTKKAPMKSQMGAGMGPPTQAMGPPMKDPMQAMGSMMSMMGKSNETPMSPPTGDALPGSPGDPHVYHVGAQDFFLNLQDAILLTGDQKNQILQIKNQNSEMKNKSEMNIKQAEEDLWYLTSSDRPDISKIETKIREIEKLKGDERLDFIRAVGKSTQTLSETQRRSAVRTSKFDGKPMDNPNSDNMPKSAPSMEPMKEMPGEM